MKNVDYLTYKLGLDYNGFKDLFSNFVRDYELELYKKFFTYNNNEIFVYENHSKGMAVIFIRSNNLTEEELYMIEHEYLLSHYKSLVFKKVFTIFCVDSLYQSVENYLKMGIDVDHPSKNMAFHFRIPFVYDISTGSFIVSNSSSFKFNKHAIIRGYVKYFDEFQSKCLPLFESFLRKNKFEVDKIKTNTMLCLDSTVKDLYYPRMVVLFKKDFYSGFVYWAFIIFTVGFLVLPVIDQFKKEDLFFDLCFSAFILTVILLFFVRILRRFRILSRNCKMIWLDCDVTKLCEKISLDGDFVFVDKFDDSCIDCDKLYLIKGDGFILVNNNGNCDKKVDKLIKVVRKFLN